MKKPAALWMDVWLPREVWLDEAGCENEHPRVTFLRTSTNRGASAPDNE